MFFPLPLFKFTQLITLFIVCFLPVIYDPRAVRRSVLVYFSFPFFSFNDFSFLAACWFTFYLTGLIWCFFFSPLAFLCLWGVLWEKQCHCRTYASVTYIDCCVISLTKCSGYPYSYTWLAYCSCLPGCVHRLALKDTKQILFYHTFLYLPLHVCVCAAEQGLHWNQTITV